MLLKPLIIGSIGFIVFTQILEKILYIVVFSNFPNYADHPWLFALYGGMAAGLFEELGRFILFTWILKKYLNFRGGISFGIGWGGRLGRFVNTYNRFTKHYLICMINAGIFETSLAAQVPSDQLLVIKETVLNQGVSFYLLGISERFFAVFMQIAFSLLVLVAAVKKRKFVYVIYAIFIHAAIDFPAAFYQTGHIKSLWIIELYLAIIGVLSFIFIKKVEKAIPQ